MSVNYQSHDAEVYQTISLLCPRFIRILISISEQVTLEIQTNPTKVGEKNKSGPAKEEKESEYDLPAELLE